MPAEFVKSCSALSDLPAPGPPEAALLGRSNVGKSSLLNRLTGVDDLARVSRTPGRTRLLNLFRLRLPAELLLVDCPGYGYAKLSRSVSSQWGALMHDYLSQREPLTLCLLLVDGTLPAQAMDLDLHVWLRRQCRQTCLIATKWDRMSGNGRAVSRRRLEAAYGEPILPWSSTTGEGRDALRKVLLAAMGASSQATLGA